MNEAQRLFWALVTACVLTWFTHWVSGAVDYQLHVGWCALIGGLTSALIWYWPYIWGAIEEVWYFLWDWDRW